MTDKMPLAIVILAAGKGTRLKSALPKVMHPLAGRPLVGWILETAEALSPEKIIVVTGPDMETLVSAVKPHTTVTQLDRKGTGDAVKTALPELKGFQGDVLILLGDMPLLTIATLEALIASRHLVGRTGLSVLGADYEVPPPYGRLVQNEDGSLKKIVEDKDCSKEESLITLCNTGAFCVDGDKLAGWVNQIMPHNAQGEFYITDLPEIAAAEGYRTAIAVTNNEDEVYGVNAREDLAVLEQIVQDELRAIAMEGGATLIDPQTVYLSFDTEIGEDVTIGPNVVIGTDVTIADKAVIHPFCHIEGAQIDEGAEVGPFARIRPQSKIGAGAVAGNFIEVNRSEMKPGAKSKHLSYLGDAVIGEKSNIGAGTVIANYDGFQKHETKVGKGAFIGTNSTIVAPVSIGDEAIVAAGSTITEDVPAESLAVARNRMAIRPGWAKEYRQKKKA